MRVLNYALQFCRYRALAKLPGYPGRRIRTPQRTMSGRRYLECGIDNVHRPYLFAETIPQAMGRQRKRYPYKLMMI